MLKKVLTNVNKQKSLNPYDLSLSEAGEEGLEPPNSIKKPNKIRRSEHIIHPC